MAMGPRGCLPRLNRVLQALSGPIYFTLIRSELMELNPYYSVPQMRPHLETAGPRHGYGTPRVPAAAQEGSAGTLRDNLFHPDPIRMDGATSILFCSASAAACGNCRSPAWLWNPAGACHGSIGFCGHCQGQFISLKFDRNGCSYIHITLFRGCLHQEKPQW